MTAISPLAKPTFVVGLSSKSFSYYDTTDWSTLTGEEVANLLSFLAILKISGPNGVFYANSGYVSGSYASPDINLKLTTEKAGISNVPVDANGDILSGQYSMYVKYKVNVQDLLSADTGTKTIVLVNSGDYSTFLTNVKLTPGAVVTIVGGPNAGTYTIASATAGFLGTVVTFNESLASNTITGSSLWVILPETINSIDFCYTIPTPVVQITSNCIQSTLICKDATEYGSAGVVIVSRENRIKYPLTMETAVADIVDTNVNINQQVTVTPIYTHTWAGLITTNFTVDKTTYSLDITIKGYLEHTVDCDIRLCGAYECLKKLVDQWKAYLGTNPTAAKSLEVKIAKLYSAFMLYSIAMECGNDAEACAQVDIIIDILGSTGCNCGCTDSVDSGYAQLILPLGSATAGAIPFSYLEINDITTNSNAKIPSNTAVITYIAALLESYYTSTQVDDGFYDKATSDSRYVRKNYKEYMAVFTQTTTNPVLVAVLVNDFGAEIDAASFIKGGFDGIYGVVAATGTPFTANKTFVQVGFGEQVSGDSSCGAFPVDNTTLQFWSKTNLTGTDGLFTNATIYIRVYN